VCSLLDGLLLSSPLISLSLTIEEESQVNLGLGSNYTSQYQELLRKFLERLAFTEWCRLTSVSILVDMCDNFTRLIKLADIIDLGRENTEIVTLLRVNDPKVKAAAPPVHRR
jgi:hypothetical protein